MRRILAWAALVAVVLAVSGLFADRQFREWKVRAERADSLAAVYLARAETAEAGAHAESARADSLAGVATQHELTARARIRAERRQVVPEPCQEIVAGRDTTIDTLLASVESLNAALTAEKQASVLLSGALTDARLAVDTLRAALNAVPTPRPSWMPTVGVGPFAGLCLDGRPCTGLGVSLQWKVRLPWPT